MSAGLCPLLTLSPQAAATASTRYLRSAITQTSTPKRHCRTPPPTFFPYPRPFFNAQLALSPSALISQTTSSALNSCRFDCNHLISELPRIQNLICEKQQQNAQQAITDTTSPSPGDQNDSPPIAEIAQQNHCLHTENIFGDDVVSVVRIEDDAPGADKNGPNGTGEPDSSGKDKIDDSSNNEDNDTDKDN
ncbi:unnamed protein product, partial [Anisakis simplex]|uniref:Uncharacterized protein n=1 Tax=Anisakis simplex TaxID=6269 RepID=A0A0M3JMR2_ANISI